MYAPIEGIGVKLKGCACHRLMSLMTSEAFWRLRKLTRPPGRLSGFPSWMNCNVERKTPDVIVRIFYIHKIDPIMGYQ